MAQVAKIEEADACDGNWEDEYHKHQLQNEFPFLGGCLPRVSYTYG